MHFNFSWRQSVTLCKLLGVHFVCVTVQNGQVIQGSTKNWVIRTATKGQKQEVDLQHNALTSLLHFAVQLHKVNPGGKCKVLEVKSLCVLLVAVMSTLFWVKVFIACLHFLYTHFYSVCNVFCGTVADPEICKGGFYFCTQ